MAAPLEAYPATPTVPLNLAIVCRGGQRVLGNAETLKLHSQQLCDLLGVASSEAAGHASSGAGAVTVLAAKEDDAQAWAQLLRLLHPAEAAPQLNWVSWFELLVGTPGGWNYRPRTQ